MRCAQWFAKRFVPTFAHLEQLYIIVVLLYCTQILDKAMDHSRGDAQLTHTAMRGTEVHSLGCFPDAHCTEAEAGCCEVVLARDR